VSEHAGQTSTGIRSTIRRGDLKYTLLAAGVLLMIVGLGSGASTLLELYRDAWPSPSRACEDVEPPDRDPELGYASGGSISWFPLGVECNFQGDDFRVSGSAMKNPSLRPTAFFYGGFVCVGLGIAGIAVSRRVRVVSPPTEREVSARS